MHHNAIHNQSNVVTDACRKNDIFKKVVPDRFVSISKPTSENIVDKSLISTTTIQQTQQANRISSYGYSVTSIVE